MTKRIVALFATIIIIFTEQSFAAVVRTTGEVVAIDLVVKTLTIRRDRGEVFIMTFNDETIVEVGDEKRAITDIKVGDKVTIDFKRDKRVDTGEKVVKRINRKPTSEEQIAIEARKEAQKKLEAEQKRIAEEEKRLAEEKRRKEIRERYDEFVKKNGIKEWPSPKALSANPFIYEGRTVAIVSEFLEMMTSTQGVFEASEEHFVVSNIPKGLFTSKGTRVLIAGRVIGKTEVKMGLVMTVPHLKFIGVHHCKDWSCSDIIVK